MNEKGEKLYEGHNGKTTTQAISGGKNNPVKLAEGLDSLTRTTSFGFGADSDSQRSQTKSGINTTHLHIRDEQGLVEKTGKTVEQVKTEIKTGIATDNAERRSGKLENRFDKDELQKELDYQVKVTQEFDKNRKEVIGYIYSKAGDARAEAAEIRRTTEKDISPTGFNLHHCWMAYLASPSKERSLLIARDCNWIKVFSLSPRIFNDFGLFGNIRPLFS
ncbi:hypothetical protein [Histophilus somni]|uniref:Uncharacterized protein n=1 Tax=Histophilus somni TaxID=731 RepID=A0A9Q7E7S7_HISSO|nr:hypothetical protein [Histophilus somni]MBB5151378.1 hypothetical protein [Histophilus somni]QQF72718.1 hypothetical protein JFL50_02360 [Histophilus somni]QQF76713.1 hypothetical protein JFL52_07755 [Histophilus somni]QQF82776.1 hypothetical protein JFL49_02330 [Histophilus somni]QQF90619.1 hypothetical protein JFL57_07765 [Histophilus somni]